MVTEAGCHSAGQAMTARPDGRRGSMGSGVGLSSGSWTTLWRNSNECGRRYSSTVLGSGAARTVALRRCSLLHRPQRPPCSSNASHNLRRCWPVVSMVNGGMIKLLPASIEQLVIIGATIPGCGLGQSDVNKHVEVDKRRWSRWQR